MKDTSGRSTRSSQAGNSPPPLYSDIFGPPALSKQGQDDMPEKDLFGNPIRSEAERAADRYQRCLARRFGLNVPMQEVDAFEAAHELGQRNPDQLEALITGIRAGVEKAQQREAATGRGGAR